MSERHEDECYFVPLEDQRVFGAGVKRKRVAFVPSTSAESSVTAAAHPTKRSSNIGDRYLALVLSTSSSRASSEPPSISQPSPADAVLPTLDTSVADATGATPGSSETSSSKICPICNLPIKFVAPSSAPHESSMSHQLSLPHSHPPSHLDREHVGLKYLSSYGWDPDGRQGLGRSGQGIRIPLKAKEKHDTAGLGVMLGKEDKDDEGSLGLRKRKERKMPTVEGPPAKKLNAKEVRRLEEQERKKSDKLQRAYYGREDVVRYLGQYE